MNFNKCFTVHILEIHFSNKCKTLNLTDVPAAYLHERCQVGVVVIQRSNDVELNLDQDTLTQVVFIRDGRQSMEQFDLGSSVRGRKKRRKGIRSDLV